MQHLQGAVIALVDHYGYVGLFVGLILGNVGFPVAAEVLVPIAGALVGTGHLSSLWLTFAVALSGELAGGGVGYAVGRFGGRVVAERYGKYVGFHYDRLDALHAFFSRYGTFAVFLCRFIPMIRGLSPFVAGVAEMDLRPFFLWTLCGSAIFCGSLLALGNALGARVSADLPSLHRFGYGIAAVAVAVIVAAFVFARLRTRRSPRVVP